MLAAIDWTAIGTVVLAIAALLGGSVAAVGWLITRGKRDQKIDDLLSKITPNGGDSGEIGDLVAGIRAEVTAISAAQVTASAEQALLADKLDEHAKQDETVQKALLVAIEAIGKVPNP